MEQDCLCVKMITLWDGIARPILHRSALYTSRANSSLKIIFSDAINTTINIFQTHAFSWAVLENGVDATAGFIKFNLHTHSTPAGADFFLYNFSVMGLTQQNQLWVLPAPPSLCDIN